MKPDPMSLHLPNCGCGCKKSSPNNGQTNFYPERDREVRMDVRSGVFYVSKAWKKTWDAKIIPAIFRKKTESATVRVRVTIEVYDD